MSSDNTGNPVASPDPSNKTDQLWQTLDTPSITVNTQSAWQKISPEITRSKTRKFSPISWAAAVILVFGIIWLANDIYRTRDSFTYSAARNQEEFLLPDHSKVLLAPGSSLTYITSKKERQVELIGSAYFTVERNVEKPFRIKSNELLIQVLGTAFEVSQNGSKNKVAVSSGQVMIKFGGDSLAMQKGDAIIWDHHRQSIKSFHNIVGIQESWESVELTFTNKELDDILDILAYRFDVDFTLENERLKNCEISGKFTTDNTTETLEQLSLALGFSFQVKGNQIEISGPGC